MTTFVEAFQPEKSPDSNPPLKTVSTPSPRPGLQESVTLTGLLAEKFGGRGLNGAGGVWLSMMLMDAEAGMKPGAVARTPTETGDSGGLPETVVRLKAAEIGPARTVTVDGTRSLAVLLESNETTRSVERIPGRVTRPALVSRPLLSRA